MNSRGFGLIEIMIYIGVMSVVIGIALQMINSQNSEQSKLRKMAQTKKSFSGAEAILINQRQCRCNFRGLRFAVDVEKSHRLTRETIKTYADDINCVNSDRDKILSTTNKAADTAAQASDIFLTHFQPIIRGLLYRTQMYITHGQAGSVTFPLVLSTALIGGEAVVDICGVDRGS